VKKWLTSKTVWAGILLIILGIINLTDGDQANGAQRILEGIGLLGLRHAVWKALLSP